MGVWICLKISRDRQPDLDRGWHVEELFEIYHAPADSFETVNTVGLPLYARMFPDHDRDEWVRLT